MKKRALLSIVVYYILILILSFAALENRESDSQLKYWRTPEGESITLPCVIKVRKPTTLVLETSFISDSTQVFLIIPPLWIQGIEIDLNGEEVFKIGTEDHYITLPNLSIPIELHTIPDENKLTLKINAVQDLFFNSAPYLSEKPDYRTMLSSILFCYVNTLSLGALALVIVYMMVLLFMRKRIYYLYFALGFVCLMLFVVHLAFMGILLKKEDYINMLRVSWFAGFLTLPLMVMSFDSVTAGNVGKCSVFSLLIGTVLGIGLVAHPTLEYFKMTLPFFFAVLVCGVYKAFRSDLWEFKLGVVVTAITTVQHGLWVLNLSPVPTLFGHGVILTLAIFSVFLGAEYLKIERELFAVRRELFVDPLTGAFNRRVLDLTNFTCSDSLVFFDLNDFKRLNDEFGHEYGDEVLRKFVSVMKKHLRKGDFVVRYGGDEFLMILKNCDIDKADEIARSVADELKENTGVGVSWGVSKCCDLESAIREADSDMYEMKFSLKNNRSPWFDTE